MINKIELRLDNWVKYDGRVFKIAILHHDCPYLDTEEFGVGIVSYQNINPIPLTPELLEKCGFEKSDLHERHYIHPATMLLEVFNKYQLGGFHFIGGRLTKDAFIATTAQLKYLHQLQNAFALTSNELTIKL